MVFKHLSTLLDDPRRRNIILVTLLLLLTVIFIGSMRLLGKIKHASAMRGTKIESVRSLRSVPGGLKQSGQKRYEDLQMEHNRQKAEQARQSEHSALATLVDSFPNDPEVKSPEAPSKTRLPKLMTEQERILADHQLFLEQQQRGMDQQQIQSAMAQQMQQLLGLWTHTPTQRHEFTETPIISNEKTEIQQRVLVKAGEILSAVLLTEINSDEPSPVLAQVRTGELKGARLIGTLSRTGERLVVQFHTIHLPHSSKTQSINALAVDETTARTSLATHVDRHLLLRYGTFFGGLLLQGYGMSFQHAGMRLVNYQLSDRDRISLAGEGTPSVAKDWLVGPLLSSTGSVSTQLGSELQAQLNRAPTVSVDEGTAIGILFATDLSEPLSHA